MDEVCECGWVSEYVALINVKLLEDVTNIGPVSRLFLSLLLIDQMPNTNESKLHKEHSDKL